MQKFSASPVAVQAASGEEGGEGHALDSRPLAGQALHSVMGVRTKAFAANMLALAALHIALAKIVAVAAL